jgi:predicted trehalose synthase
MRAECTGSRWDCAGHLDNCRVSTVRSETAVSPVRDFEGQAVATARSEAGALCETVMGEMKRAIAHEREDWAGRMDERSRMTSTLVITAAIIAAVRLAREDISKPSPPAAFSFRIFPGGLRVG